MEERSKNNLRKFIAGLEKRWDSIDQLSQIVFETFLVGMCIRRYCPFDGFAIDRQFAGLDITQPDLCNALARVQRELDIRGRIRALLSETSTINRTSAGCRVSVGIVGAFDEGNVRLRFAPFVKDDGVLPPHHITGGRAAAETLGKSVDEKRLPAAYRRHIHQFSIDQLDAVGLIQ
jgi:hypothetical protein